MKIAVLSHLKYAIAQPFSGGLEMHTHLLADSLIRRGHDVTLFAAQGSDLRLGLRALCDPTGEGGDDTVAQDVVDSAETEAYRLMMDEVAIGDFDLVHNNSLHPLPLRAASLLDAPMVTTLHTPPFEPLATAMSEAGPRVSIVAVSADLAKQWRGVVDVMGVVQNGIDLTVFRPTRRQAATMHALWFGRIVPEKGLHFAIEAVRMAGLPLLFAGPRPDEDYWNREIAPRLGDDLTDLGHLAHAELARHLAQASVAIVTPCWDEPFGLVIAESLASGTPVAAFARGAIPSLVNAQCGVLARPGDAADLARAIAGALRCERRACRAYAEERFDSERMVDHYEALYAQLTLRSRSSSDAIHTAAPSGELDEALA